ncbi:MAG: response regulator transcription factor [Ignavibacteriales bacterium]|nr:response regulator transcription factor [Ignavibacteriales bacterium]
MGKIKILIADDEPDILDFLKYNLEKEDYQVFTTIDGEQAFNIAKSEQPDLVILDIMMPKLDGVEVCRMIRNDIVLKDTLVAFLTARNEDYSQIAGFEVGADDYITKPIRPRVFIARVKALIKRKSIDTSTEDILQVGDLIVDSSRRIVKVKNEVIELPKKEFEFLVLLASKPGRVFTRDEIYFKIWGDEVIVSERTLDVYVRKIREKIGEGFIKTVKGIGYKLDF